MIGTIASVLEVLPSGMFIKPENGKGGAMVVYGKFYYRAGDRIRIEYIHKEESTQRTIKIHGIVK